MPEKADEDLMTYTWVRLRSGIEPHVVRRHLILKGKSDPEIRNLMQEAYEGRRPSADVDFAALSAPALTRRAAG
ncbi:MAG: hypothetical protein Q8L84_09230, partial [Hyphomonas sp.]|nr:hypothetical protein [Hyphomonas sp.]